MVQFTQPKLHFRAGTDEMVDGAGREHQNQAETIDEKRQLAEELTSSQVKQDDQPDASGNGGAKMRKSIDGLTNFKASLAFLHVSSILFYGHIRLYMGKHYAKFNFTLDHIILKTPSKIEFNVTKLKNLL
jgi:hypothetical protein